MQRCLLSILIWTIPVYAQAPAGIPACATSAISSGIRGSGCANDNIDCICDSKNFKFAIESAADVCNDKDQEALHDTIKSICYNDVLEVRDVAEDDGAGEVAAEGTDQATLETPVGPGTATVASEGTDQATLGTPVLASTPTIGTEGTDQATLPTPVPASTPTIAIENSNQATLSTPTVIAAPQTPLPTTATSIVTDTREFSNPRSSSNSMVTSLQAAEGDDPSGLTSATTTSPTSDSTVLLSANATSSRTDSPLSQGQSSITGEAPSEVVVSVGALFVAVVGLTWVFAEF